jgi:hypothetical protein
MMSDTAPKLKKGMKAFTFTKEGKFFHLQSTKLSPMYPQHAEAFKVAADLILDSHEAAVGGPHNDKLLYPVLYLYRHALELKLKDLVMLGVRCGDLAFADVEETLGAHELCPLWTKARLFLSKHYPEDKQLPIIEAIIQEFHQVDRDGQTLRYDRQKDLRKRGYEKLPQYISVTNLRTTMDAVYSHLDSAYGGVLDWWDAGQEAARS